MYGLSAKKNGRCREVTVVERWPLLRGGRCGEVAVTAGSTVLKEAFKNVLL